MHTSSPRLLTLLGAAALLIVGAALSVNWDSSVVVRGSDGRIVAWSPLSDSGSFEIEYVHSYYRTPVVETFVAERSSGFRLDAISSTSEAALDYYELEGARSSEGRWLRLVPNRAQHFEVLPLIGTAKGRKTLVLPDRKIPLFRDDGRPVHLTLRVEQNTPLTKILGLLKPENRSHSVPPVSEGFLDKGGLATCLTRVSAQTILDFQVGKDNRCPTNANA